VVETSGSNAAHDGEKLEQFLEDVMGAGMVLGERRAALCLLCLMEAGLVPGERRWRSRAVLGATTIPQPSMLFNPDCCRHS
jgi:hypothetical protein